MVISCICGIILCYYSSLSLSFLTLPIPYFAGPPSSIMISFFFAIKNNCMFHIFQSSVDYVSLFNFACIVSSVAVKWMCKCLSGVAPSPTRPVFSCLRGSPLNSLVTAPVYHPNNAEWVSPLRPLQDLLSSLSQRKSCALAGMDSDCF